MRIPTAQLIVSIAAAGLVASCAASSSGPDISAVDKSFLRGIGSYDQNHDGVVTCDEWRAAMAGLFTKANKSGSGTLNPDEFQTLATIDRTFLVASFKYYDVNGDGKVDKKEFVDRPNPAFTYADKDKDCRLTDLELITTRNLSAVATDATPSHSSITGGSQTGNASPGGPGSRY